MANTLSHHVVVVTAKGAVLGIISTIDILREQFDLPPSRPEAFPHADKQYNIKWANQNLFTFTNAAKTPEEPRLFSIIGTTVRGDDRVLWTEFAPNLRSRLCQLISHPNKEVFALRSIMQTNNLRFREAHAEHSPATDHIVETLQRPGLDSRQSKLHVSTDHSRFLTFKNILNQISEWYLVNIKIRLGP